MRKGNTKSAKGKRLAVTEADRVVVGLDVHKREIHAAVRVNGQEVGTHVLPARPAAVEKFLAPYRPGLKHVVYEAGPTGYGLARHLRSAGVPVDVIAPSKTPQTPGDRSKSDRLDCLELARLDEANLLKAVGVPTEEEEAERQVIRLRDQAVDDRRRVRQRIKSFLLMHGLAEPAGLEHWSAAGVGDAGPGAAGASKRGATAGRAADQGGPGPTAVTAGGGGVGVDPLRRRGPEGVPASGAQHRLGAEGDRGHGAAAGVGPVETARESAGGGLTAPAHDTTTAQQRASGERQDSTTRRAGVIRRNGRTAPSDAGRARSKGFGRWGVHDGRLCCQARC